MTPACRTRCSPRPVTSSSHCRPGRNYQLLRVRVDGDLEIVPEISVHRLQVSVRWMKQDGEGRLRPTAQDTAFELSLCS